MGVLSFAGGYFDFGGGGGGGGGFFVFLENDAIYVMLPPTCKDIFGILGVILGR